jgi:uncharacterized protein
MLASLLRKHRKRILELAKQHGVEKVRLFGSVVRGEDTETSDIDFLIELAPGRSLLDRIAFIQDMEDLLGRKVDAVTLPGIHETFRDHILAEAAPL